MPDINKARTTLKGKAGVISVGYGYKKKAGVLTGIPSFIVYVKKKLPVSTLAASDVVPATIEDMPTDVIEIETVDALALTERKRPCPGGYSIGHPSITAGSAGLPVVFKEELKALLSNAHVLSPYWDTRVQRGDPIIIPGPLDDGQNPDDAIAHLYSWAPIDPGGGNKVDAALALIDLTKVDWRIEKLATIYSKAGSPELGQNVIKVGRTTELTRGRITAIGAAIYVNYQTFTALFTDQIQITPDSGSFIEGGDSGSALLSDDGIEVLGLCFAGGGGIGYANHIQNVMEALKFEIRPKPVEPVETIEGQLASISQYSPLVYGYKAGKWSVWPKQSSYDVIKKLTTGYGYWVKVDRDCSLNYTYIWQLSKGWNLIGWR